MQQLRAGRFELGFAGAQEQSPELVFLPFFRDRMVLITPNTPHFAKLLQDGTPVRNILEREPLLLREAGSGSQKCGDTFLEEEGLSQRTLHVAARLEDQQSIKNLVSAGLGVSIISGKAAQDDCASGRLLAFPLPANRAGRSLYLVWRKNGALLCVVPRMEAARLKKIVSECDAHAFVTVCDVHEALGEGFSYRHIS